MKGKRLKTALKDLSQLGCLLCGCSKLAFGIDRECSSARFMAMGGTGISIAEPSIEAICYNPAGLAQSKKWLNEIILASPLITISSDAQTLSEDISAQPNPLTLVQKYSEKPQHVGIENITGIFLNRVALSVYQKAQAEVLVSTDPVSGTPQAEAQGAAWLGLGLTFARNVWESGKSNVSLGTHLKFQHKSEAATHVGIKDIETLKDKKDQFKDQLKRGNGLGADIGLLWKLEGRSSPKIGVVAKNLGMVYRWPLKPNKISPNREPQTLHLGFSLEPETKKSRMVLAFDIEDVFNATKMIVFKRLHFGALINFMDVIGVMGGFNQGYPTYGAFLSLKFVKIEGGMTSEELGKQPGERQSKRMFARVSVGWLQ